MRLKRWIVFGLVGWLITTCLIIFVLFKKFHNLERASDTTRVRTLIVLDERGRERIVIDSPLPNPEVNGRTVKRRTGVSAGIQFKDATSVERGGIAVEDNGSFMFGIDDERGQDRATSTTFRSEDQVFIFKVKMENVAASSKRLWRRQTRDDKRGRTGRAEVNAAKDAGVANRRQSRGNVGEGTDYADHHVGVHNEGAVFAEVVRQYGRPGGAGGGVARRILRVRRCVMRSGVQ